MKGGIAVGIFIIAVLLIFVAGSLLKKDTETQTLQKSLDQDTYVVISEPEKILGSNSLKTIRVKREEDGIIIKIISINLSPKIGEKVRVKSLIMHANIEQNQNVQFLYIE